MQSLGAPQTLCGSAGNLSSAHGARYGGLGAVDGTQVCCVCRFSMMGFGGLGGVCLRSFLLGSLELCIVGLMAGPGVIGVLESK